jgi:aminopeptidase YwaD
MKDREALENSAMRHLARLCVEIGPRPVGSRENQAAAEAIRSAFEACALDVEMQGFACPLWEEASTRLEAGGESLTAAANSFSAPCDVTAPALALGTLDELKAADLEGQIGVLHGDLTKDHGFGARSAFYCPDNHRQIVQLLEAKRPAALVTVHSTPGSLERLMRDWEFPIPSATVPAEAGRALLEFGRRSVHLRIESRQSPSQFHNVVARKAGARPERVLLLAHFDTMANTPGAFDNASGIAVLLALAERLASADLGIGIEWLAVNGEEVGGLGDAAYLLQREHELDQVLAAINLDGVGQRLGVTSVTAMGGSQAFEERVRQVRGRYPGTVWVDPWYESDHTAFLQQGVPCIPLTSVGAANTAHLPSDTLEWISPAKLSEAALLVTDLLESLRGESPDWCREG